MSSHLLIANLPNGHPGCLVATVTHAERLFDRPTRELNRQGILSWRRRFHTILAELAKRLSSNFKTKKAGTRPARFSIASEPRG